MRKLNCTCITQKKIVILHPEKPKSNQGRLKRHRECLESDPQCDGKYSIFLVTRLKNEEIRTQG